MKNTIKAVIVADSMNKQRDRLTTFVVTFPRMILAEFNTHRMFSRNSASSRAIPFEKMVKMVEEDPFVPIAWQKDHKGMQGNEYLNEEHSKFAEKTWLLARDYAVERSKVLNDSVAYESVTKQLCNRLLEPFMWHTVIVTCGREGLENFFELRCPQYRPDLSVPTTYRSRKDVCNDYSCFSLNIADSWWHSINKGQSEIHMMALAEAMYDAYNSSMPYNLKDGEWHIPFGDDIDLDRMIDVTPLEKNSPQHDMDIWAIKIAVARCARVSYLNFEGKDDYVSDFKLFDMLKESGHWSPFEHVARAMSAEEHQQFSMTTPVHTYFGRCLNLRGFIQLRFLLE